MRTPDDRLDLAGPAVAAPGEAISPAPALRQYLGVHASVSDAEADRAAAAKDFSWVSPLISQNIPRTLPDVVVSPTDIDGVRLVALWAFHNEVPLTPRGRGTTNYGQTIPLARGIVCDMTQVRGTIDIDTDATVVRSPAGTTFEELIDALEGSGWELASYPTTLNSTVGGWIGGGSGGPGSLEHGLNHEGVVRELRVIPLDGTSQEVEVAWPDTTAHVHAYGTTGLITSVGLQIVPAREWTSLFASVPDLDVGAALALAILHHGVRPKILAVTEPQLAALFPEDPGLEPGQTNLRLLLDVSTVELVSDLVTAHGGRVTSVRSDANRFLGTLINNHATLRAKAAQPDLFHVLIRGDAIVGRRDLVEDTYPGASMQLEGGRVDGRLTLTGRILAPFVSNDAVQAGMDRLSAEGIMVDNPHTWLVHTDLPARWDLSRRFDPRGLLNPGKLTPLDAERAQPVTENTGE